MTYSLVRTAILSCLNKIELRQNIVSERERSVASSNRMATKSKEISRIKNNVMKTKEIKKKIIYEKNYETDTKKKKG